MVSPAVTILPDISLCSLEMQDVCQILHIYFILIFQFVMQNISCCKRQFLPVAQLNGKLRQSLPYTLSGFVAPARIVCLTRENYKLPQFEQ